MKKRVEWIDVMKYICMMFIMYSHTDFNTEVMELFYRPFFLFGFFFASGYVYENKDRFSVFIKKKIRGILIPWLLYGLLLIFSARIVSFNQHASLGYELLCMFAQIRGLDDKMWFLAALFVAFIPFYFIIKKYEQTEKSLIDRMILIGMSFVLAFVSNIYSYYMNPELLPWGKTALPWHVEYIFKAMFWMVLGYLFKEGFEKIYDENISNVIKLASFFAYILLVWFIKPAIYASINYKLFHITFDYFVAFLALFTLTYICKIIKTNRYISYIGQNTLNCFGLHGKGYSALQTLFAKINHSLYSTILGSDLLSVVVGIVFTFVLSVLLIIPIYAINRWIPILAGKGWRKDHK